MHSLLRAAIVLCAVKVFSMPVLGAEKKYEFECFKADCAFDCMYGRNIIRQRDVQKRFRACYTDCVNELKEQLCWVEFQNPAIELPGAHSNLAEIEEMLEKRKRARERMRPESRMIGRP